MYVFCQLLINGVVLGSTYAIIAMSFALVFNTVHLFHLIHGAIFTWGAYAAWVVLIGLGLPLWVAVLGTLLVTGIMGAFSELAIYRPLRRRGAGPLMVLLGSLGVLIVLNSMAALVFGETALKARGGLARSYDIGGVIITDMGIASIVVFALVTVILVGFLNFTKIGTAIRAVANDPGMSRVVGINTDRIFLATFVAGSLAVAPASILIVMDTGMTPYGGFDIIVVSLVCLVLGGIGKLSGAAIGGMFVGIITCLVPWKLPTLWQELVVFLIFLVFIYFRPRGFIGKKAWQAEV